MIQLESIILPDLYWDDEFLFTGVRAVVDQTLGGRNLIWEDEEKGRPITLKGNVDRAWLQRGILIELHKMASIPKANYLLVYENRNFMVRFRNEDKPCISPEALIERPNMTNSDYYINVVLKFMEV